MTATPSDPLEISDDLIGSQETYWYHASFTEDSNISNGGSSGLCYGITIAEVYLETNVSLDNNGGDDPSNGGGNGDDGSSNDGSDSGGDDGGGSGGSDASTDAAVLIVTVTLDNNTRLRANTKKEIYVTVTDDQGAPIEQALVTISLNTINYTLRCEEVEPGSYKAVLETSQVAAGDYIVTVTVEKTGYHTAEQQYTVTVTPGLNLAAISFSARIGAISGISIILTLIGKRKLFDDITLEL
jgi:hypothetical protein